MVIADTGTTEHMFPDKSAFISYHRVSNIRVCLGNDSFASALGGGTISLNRYKILVLDVLHVPSLHTPLYSPHAHHCQRGCGFIGDEDLGGIFVYFPTFILSVDTSVDCHLHYLPMGRSTALSELHYAQPKGAFKPAFSKQATNTNHNNWRTV